MLTVYVLLEQRSRLIIHAEIRPPTLKLENGLVQGQTLVFDTMSNKYQANTFHVRALNDAVVLVAQVLQPGHAAFQLLGRVAVGDVEHFLSDIGLEVVGGVQVVSHDLDNASDIELGQSSRPNSPLVGNKQGVTPLGKGGDGRVLPTAQGSSVCGGVAVDFITAHHTLTRL